jgi:hypothetical protein
VCKASGRYQLFLDAVVHLRYDSDAFKFSRLLDGAGSITRYIHHLDVFYNFRKDLPEGILRFPEFVSITSLHLRYTHSNTIPTVAISLGQKFQTLTTFELDFISLPFAQFLGIVEAFPLLQRMSLINVTLDGEPSPNNQPFLLSHLRELELDFCAYFSELLDWLLAYEQIPAIKKFKLCKHPQHLDISGDRAVGRFLRSIGPALEHLHLCFRIDPMHSMAFRFRRVQFHS